MIRSMGPKLSPDNQQRRREDCCLFRCVVTLVSGLFSSCQKDGGVATDPKLDSRILAVLATHEEHSTVSPTTSSKSHVGPVSVSTPVGSESPHSITAHKSNLQTVRLSDLRVTIPSTPSNARITPLG